jgi:hypothetical protein
LSGLAATLPLLLLAGSAHADFNIGGDSSVDDLYVYTTRDLAVDLASPLVAYRVVTAALQQSVPTWLDAIIIAASLGAIYVVLTGDTSLDRFLQ